MASYDDTATVSGSVVGFSNGADSVPLKNWQVTLPANLSGYSEVNGVQTGKNLFNINASSGTPDPTDGSNTTSPRVLEVDKFFIGLRSDNYYYPQYANVTIQNNSITVTNGSNNAYGACYCFEVKEGVDYTISVTCSDNYILSVGAYSETWAFLGGVGTSVSNASKTFTAPTSARYCVCVFRSAANASATFTNVQIEVGSTATAYEPYAAPTQYTASLGRTIYGGTADIVTGEGEDENGNAFTFTPITPTPETALGVSNWWSEQGDSEVTYYKSGYGFTSVTVHKETPEGEPVEETRKLHRIIYEGQVDVINGTGLIYRGESGTQYDPPEQISFTPIEVSTDEGENTLYADEGDSAITYRKAVD